MLLVLFFASLVAFAISAIAGGGASLLVVPLLGRVVRIAAVPAALSIGTGASSVSRIVAFHRAIDWRIAGWFVPAAVPMALAGALLLRFLNPVYLQVLMALFLLANIPQLLKPQAEVMGERASRWQIVAIGAAAGFLSGLTGAVGVLFNRFYLTHGLSKQEIVATRATNEVLIHLIKLIVYARLGLLDADALTAGAIVGVAAASSSLLLKLVLRFIPHVAFARVGYAAMIASGLALLSDSVSRVVREDRVAFDARPVVTGVDARVHWRDSSLALEINYDEGIEVEVGVKRADLAPALRALVASYDPGGAHVDIEEVYSLQGRSFEVYYIRHGQLVRKIEFDADGKVLEQDR